MFYNTDLTSTSEMVDLHKGYLVQLGRFALWSVIIKIRGGGGRGERVVGGGGEEELMGAWVLNQT